MTRPSYFGRLGDAEVPGARDGCYPVRPEVLGHAEGHAGNRHLGRVERTFPGWPGRCSGPPHALPDHTAGPVRHLGPRCEARVVGPVPLRGRGSA